MLNKGANKATFKKQRTQPQQPQPQQIPLQQIPLQPILPTKCCQPEETLDTNIFSVDLGFLNQTYDLRLGEAQYCSYCKSILSHLDQLENIPNGKKWKCKYCSTENIITQILEEEIPDKPILDYIISMPEEQQMNNTMVYCIDTSGSMSMNVKSFNRGKYMTRLDTVKKAIMSQLQGIRQNNPQQKICLIEFNRTVTIHGDCTQQPIVLSSKLLNDYDAIVEIAKEKVNLQPISKTFSNIIQTVNKMEEQGSTALGPALLMATIIAGKEQGSQVILCTDGISNVGLGNCEEHKDESQIFYSQIGDMAIEKGIVININTIQGCDSNLEIISQTSTKSNGDVLVVDPNDLVDIFMENLNEQLIATDVTISIFLPPVVYIENNLHNETPNRKKVIFGNVKEDSRYQFKYILRSEEDIKSLTSLTKEEWKEMKEKKTFPIQIQIEYRKINGMKGIRVISEIIEIAEENEEIEINGEVIQPFYIREAADQRMKGNKEESRRNMRHFRQAQMCSNTMNQSLYSSYADDMEEMMEIQNDYSATAFRNAQQFTPMRAQKFKKYSKK